MRLDKFGITIIIVAVILAFIAGCNLVYYKYPKVVKDEVVRYYSIPIVVSVDRYVPVIKYVTLPPEIKYVTKTEYVEKSVDVIIKKELIDFPDKETLIEWVSNNSNSALLSFDENGTVDLRDMNCVSFARGMQRLAEKDGYRINQQVIFGGTLMGYEVTEFKGEHIICLADVNGDYYAIEPQTGQVTYVGSDYNKNKASVEATSSH
jgi:hypothetical protein